MSARKSRATRYVVRVDDRWMHQAACVDRLDLPWITDTIDLHPGDAAAMAEVCRGCPVRDACLTYVRAVPVTGGTWAGKDRNPNLRTPVQDPLPGMGHVA